MSNRKNLAYLQGARMKTIQGFDYALGRPVELTRQEWRERAAKSEKVIQTQGETWVFAWSKRDILELDVEIYAQGVLR